jgi:hypothetical protein
MTAHISPLLSSVRARLIAATVIAAACAASATPALAASQSLVIRASASSIRVGNYQILDKSHQQPTYARAIAAFGTPQSCVLQHWASGSVANNWGRATWRTLGLRMDFLTYGMIPNGGDACSAPEGVYLDSLVITGKQWRTALGLRVGASVARLQHLYPRALPHGNSFWLITGKNMVGTESLYPVVAATIKNGHVSALVFRIGAEGD